MGWRPGRHITLLANSYPLNKPPAKASRVQWRAQIVHSFCHCSGQIRPQGPEFGNWAEMASSLLLLADQITCLGPGCRAIARKAKEFSAPAVAVGRSNWASMQQWGMNTLIRSLLGFPFLILWPEKAGLFFSVPIGNSRWQASLAPSPGVHERLKENPVNSP